MEEYFSKPVYKIHASKANLGEVIGQREKHCIFYCRIKTNEISKTLRKMKVKKVVGPDDLSLEMWKMHGRSGLIAN